jgi:hypothetical protein
MINFKDMFQDKYYGYNLRINVKVQEHGKVLRLKFMVYHFG